LRRSSSRFFLSSFAALLCQDTWQRILVFFSGADVSSITITVSAFMVEMGPGSVAGGYLADRLLVRGRIGLFAICELAFSLCALVSAGIYHGLLYMRRAHIGQTNFPFPMPNGASGACRWCKPPARKHEAR
jgi:spermidine synthase